MNNKEIEVVNNLPASKDTNTELSTLNQSRGSRERFSASGSKEPSGTSEKLAFFSVFLNKSLSK